MNFKKLIFFYFFLLISTSHGLSYDQKNISKLFSEGKYDECQKDLLNTLNASKEKLSKENSIRIYTDLGKISLIKTNYSQALNYLIKAKSLNVGDSIHLGFYYSAFGDLFKNLGAYSRAIENYKLAYKHSNSALGKYFNSNSIGTMFLNINLPDSAIKYFKNQKLDAIRLDDYIAASSSLNNIGIAYLKKNDFQTALTCFEDALGILNQNSNRKSKYFNTEKTSFKINVIGNIGRCYFSLRNYTKAIHYLEQFFLLSKRDFIYPNRLVSEETLIQSYLFENRIKDAHRVCDFFLNIPDKYSTRAKIDLANMQLAISIYEGNDQLSQVHFNHLKQLEKDLENELASNTDKMNNLVSVFLETEAKRSLLFEKKEKLQLSRSLELEAQRGNLNYIIFIFSIALIFSIGAIYFQVHKNKRKKIEIEKQLLQLEDEKQKLKLKIQENYLTDFAIENNRQKKQSEEIIENLGSLILLNNDELKKEMKSLILELKNKQIFDKHLEELNQQSEILLLNFKTSLIDKHPLLSKTDVELACLIRLNLSNKEIALFRGISNDSVKTLKNRLKRKINSNYEISLTQYLSSL